MIETSVIIRVVKESMFGKFVRLRSETKFDADQPVGQIVSARITGTDGAALRAEVATASP